MNEDKTRKAPDIKPDYVTMARRSFETKRRPWLAGVLFAVAIAMIWATAYALHADLPAWMDLPIIYTGIAMGAAAFVGGLNCIIEG